MLNSLKPRILVVDDDPAIGNLLRRHFETTGEFVVLSTTDPHGALNQARVFKPDLTILDVKMPGVNGLELAREIRQEPGLRHRPIVFYTGMAQYEKGCHGAGGEGPTRFLVKGASIRNMNQAVEDLLSPQLESYRKFRQLQDVATD